MLMMHSLFNSLRTRLLLLVLFSVLPAIILLLWMAREEYRIEKAKIEEDAMRLVRIAAEDHKNLFRDAHLLLETLAHLQEVENKDIHEFRKIMTDLSRRYPLFSNMGLVAPDGEVLCSTAPSNFPVNFSDRAWFKRTLETRHFVISEWVVGKVSKKPILSLSYPVFDLADEVRVILYASIDLNWLNQFSAQVQLPEGATLTIFDNNCTILARQPAPEEWVGKTFPDLPRFKLMMDRGEGIAELTGVDGIERLYAFTPLCGASEGNVILSIGIPSDAAKNRMRRVLKYSGGLGLLAIFVVLSTWTFAEVSIVRQIKRCLHVAKEAEEGNLGVRIGPPYPAGEIGELALLLDRMGRALLCRETKQKNAEEALRQSEELLRTVLDNLPIGVWILDGNGRTLTANPAGLSILGADNDFSVERYGQCRAWEFGSGRPIEGDAWALLQALKEGKTATEETVVIESFDGLLKIILNSAAPIRDPRGNVMGAIAVNQDISERKRAEEALRESENFYRTVFETTGTAMFLVEEDTTISLVNSEFEKISGHSRKETEGKKSWTVLSIPEEIELHKEIHRQTVLHSNAAPRQLETRGKTKAGDIKDVLINANVIPGTKRTVVSVLDITQRKQAEEALRQSVAELKNLQYITRKLLQLEELPSVMHTIAEGIVSHLGYSLALVARYLERESAFTCFCLYPHNPDLTGHGSAREASPEHGIKYEPGTSPLLDQVLKGQRVICSSLHNLIPHQLFDSILTVEEHDGRQLYIAMPMQLRKETVGIIIAQCRKDGITYRPRGALCRVAEMGAVAIASTRLYESIKKRKEELKALAAKLQEIDEAQRKQLAQELHDRVGQNLTGLSINLGIINGQLPPASVESIGPRISDSIALVGDTMKCIRDVMAELHPPGLSDYGLAAALKYYCGQMSKRFGLDIVTRLEEMSSRPEKDIEMALFRIAQEALNNAVKYSKATRVSVVVRLSKGKIVLSITDNGSGFDAKTVSCLGEGAGFGLINMRERAEGAGGELRVKSVPGRGTKIIVVIKG
jgi:PAS domain S-box-containing protein